MSEPEEIEEPNELDTTGMTEEEQLLAAQVYECLTLASTQSPRSQQAADFKIGVSDIGTCQERTRRLLLGVPEQPCDVLPAWLGTVVGDGLEKAVAAQVEGALLGQEVSLDLEGDGGTYTLTGHPDVIFPWGVADFKGLALDTVLPTPQGWTTMERVKVGDLVLDMDGKPVRVRGVSEVKNIGCYRVTLRNNHQIVCDENHIWWADVHGKGLREWTIGDLFERQAQGIRIPVAQMLDLPESDQPVDGWLLGYWLGNGSTASGNTLSCHAQDADEICALVASSGYVAWHRSSSENGSVVHVSTPGGPGRDGRGCFTPGGISKALADLGVLGDKHVPVKYMRGSIQQRLGILRGLMDSDGSWNRRRGRVVFSSVDQHLSRQVAELARSLGQRVQINGTRHHGFGLDVIAWCVEWTPTVNPFALTRKAELVNFAPGKAKDYTSHHRVVGIEAVNSVPTRCISVDSQTRSFLCGEAMIPTHNTVDGLEKVRRTGPTFQQLFQRHAYTLGAANAGLLAVPLEEARTANIWVDRSGRTKNLWCHMDNYNPEVIAEGAMWLDDVAYAIRTGQTARKEPPRQWCQVACLAAETEVVTRWGIREIGDLAGGKHELLVPTQQGNGLAPHGSWREVEVRSFGTQPLRKITIERQRATKIIYATPEHEWFIREPDSHTTTQRVVATDSLEPGTALRSIRRNNSGGVQQVPVAVLHGFVYGDGSYKGPTCAVDIHDTSTWKSNTMLPRFAGHSMRRNTREDGWTVAGLPSLWKEPPELRESTPYLISWLAGYFAADGCVTPGAKCSISSTRYESAQLIRSICAIVGIGYGPIQTEVRQPGSGIKGEAESTLYRVTLVRSTLPDWFLLHEHHRAYAEKQARQQSPWRVRSVEATDRVEEVFCAVVPEVGAFALADDLLTHNCGHFEDCRAFELDVEGLITHDDILTSYEMYQEGKAAEAAGKRLKKEGQAGLVGVQGYTPDGFQIAWTHVNPSEYSVSRRAYDRINITKVKTK